MQRLDGPWCFGELMSWPSEIPWEDDQKGAYVIVVPEAAWPSWEPAPAPILYIGGMTDSEYASLRHRLGSFLADALGLSHEGWGHHSGGTRAHNWLRRAGISPWETRVYWRVTSDPECAEAHLFLQYQQTYGIRRAPACARRRTAGCGLHGGSVNPSQGLRLPGRGEY